MKKILLHPIIITIFILIAIVSLPLLIPKKRVERLSDRELRSLALNGNMLPIPKSGFDIDKQKAMLGERLFFDKRLSKDNSLSCASCHNLENGGADGRETAIGYNCKSNPLHLNTPTILNASLFKFLFWDGRAKSLKEQVEESLRSPFEMDMKPKEIENRLNRDLTLVLEFKKVFGKDKIEFQDVVDAIKAYEKTLVTRSAYDRFLEGDNSAISDSAKRGMSIFIVKGCKSCHNGMALGGEVMQRFPIVKPFSIFQSNRPYLPFKNVGGFLGKDNRLIFRVPTLRNITKTAPYFHNGVVKDLKEAVRVMSKYQLGDEFSREDIYDIVAFLKTLEAEDIKP